MAVPILTPGSELAAALQTVPPPGGSAGSTTAWRAGVPPHPAVLLAEVHVAIADETDVVTARQNSRELAAGNGFPATDQTLIATAISELARNIIAYAQRGEIIVAPLELRGRRGIMIVARDDGPGIADVARAMTAGGSAGHSLGRGLLGTKYLMDEFELISTVGKGTTVTLRKWVR